MRKESKIPLLLTVVVLGFIVHWAIGYVQKHKKTEPAVVKTVVVEPRAPQVPLVQQAPTSIAEAKERPAPTGPVAAQQRPEVDPESYVIPKPSGAQAASGRPVNKKLTALLDAAGKRG